MIKAILLSFFLIFSLAYTNEALAKVDTITVQPGIMNKATASLKDTAVKVGEPLAKAAKQLLLSLAVISFFFTCFKLLFSNPDFNSLFSEMIKFILSIGFFIWILNFGLKGLINIVEDFAGIISVDYSTSLDTSNPANFAGSIFDTGADLFYKLMTNADKSDTSWWSISDNISVVFRLFLRFSLALSILLIFTLVAISYIINITKIYFTICCGVLAVGFGGLTWTNSWAVNYLKQLVKLGVEIMTLTFLVIVCVYAVNDFVNKLKISPDNPIAIGDYISVLVMAILMLITCHSIPSAVVAMFEGGSTGSKFISAAGAASTAIQTAKATAKTARMASKGVKSIASGVKSIANLFNKGNSSVADASSMTIGKK